jgi:hypothetical protein
VQQATNMCNWQNVKDGFDVTVTRNTLMNTFRRIVDVDISTVGDHHKTGSKDLSGALVVARSVLAAQMASQYRYGEQIDKGEAVFDCCLPPPLWVHGILWANKNHLQQCIGGSGHVSLFSSQQIHISENGETGNLLMCKAELVIESMFILL